MNRHVRVLISVFCIFFLTGVVFIRSQANASDQAKIQAEKISGAQSVEISKLKVSEANTAEPVTVLPILPTLPVLRSLPVLPVSVSIPSISLNSEIVPLGTDELGNMDVPSGKTDLVGWYKRGPQPGQVGTAVLDAHVFAAFTDLKKVQVGDDIFVTTESGEKLHFKVEKTKVYKLGELDPSVLFDQNDKRRLNLITCAGTLTADHSTYTHRLVVFAVLVTSSN